MAALCWPFSALTRLQESARLSWYSPLYASYVSELDMRGFDPDDDELPDAGLDEDGFELFLA